MKDDRTLAQKLLGIMHLARRRMNADLRHLDKKYLVEPAHLPVLASLRHRTYNVSELAERLEVSLPSMSKTVTALVKRGWVERVRLQEDRRVVQLHLTDDGKKILGEMREKALSAVAGMLDPLTPDQRQQLAEGLDTLYTSLGEALDKLPPAPPQASDKEE
jgi:DNA-binding MarR family transcriptional regulator